MHMIAKMTALLCLCAASTSGAHAQIGDSSLPLDIEADRTEVFDADRHILWLGNVIATQGDSSIRADRIDTFFSSEGAGGKRHTGKLSRDPRGCPLISP